MRRRYQRKSKVALKLNCQIWRLIQWIWPINSGIIIHRNEVLFSSLESSAVPNVLSRECQQIHFSFSYLQKPWEPWMEDASPLSWQQLPQSDSRTYSSYRLGWPQKTNPRKRMIFCIEYTGVPIDVCSTFPKQCWMQKTVSLRSHCACTVITLWDC